MRHKNSEYKNYPKITVKQEINSSSAILVGVLLILVFLIIKGSDMKYDKNYTLMYSYLIIGIPVISRLFFIPWTYYLAKKIGKDITLWIIFGLLSPAITLIILGFSDVKLESIVANKIIKKNRDNYNREISEIKKTLINENELNTKIESLTQKFNNKMQQELKEYYSK